MKTLLLTLTMCVFVLPADAQYSGGTGEPNDPYQIATAADLIALGETPEDYDKHFILTADIDLDPNLPGGKVFDRAVIASDGLGFSGVLDGNSHTISHLTINGGMNVGMFGWLRDGAEVRGLGMVDIDITGDNHVGGLVGVNSGTVIQCYSTASVMGAYSVGGLVGSNYGGSIAMSHSSSMVSGTDYYVGGLVGYNDGSVATSYSSGSVSGYEEVGGLVGVNGGTVLSSYAACDVTGDSYVGGLVGSNGGYCSRGDCPCFTGTICDCYSTGGVTGGDYVAGLVGYNMGGVNRCYSAGAVTGATTNISGLVVAGGECGYYMGPTYRVDYVNVCFWDVQVSGQATSDGGIGKNTAEMQTAGIFLETGWDFVGETENGTDDIWKIAEGLGYPRLWWEKYSGGTGEPNDPYQLATAADLIALGETPEDYDKHFVLIADIDLDPNLPGRKVFDRAVIAPDTNNTENGVQGTPFTGVVDGNGHTISNLTIVGGGYLGLVGWLVRSEPRGQLLRLGIVDVNIGGSGDCISGLVGYTYGGTVTNCYSTGVVRGGDAVGGLVGRANFSRISASYSTGAVSGSYSIGGLVGVNKGGDVTQCYSIVSVTGEHGVGGLVGSHSGYWLRGRLYGAVFQCRSAGTIRGYSGVGGLVGSSYPSETVDCGGLVKQCCSSATVAGEHDVGGLVGINLGVVADSYCTGTVSGTGGVGGLVGYTRSGYCLNSPVGGLSVTRCYSTGNVAGTSGVGGLVAQSEPRWGGEIICYSFWDIQTSGQTTSASGAGKITAEMQTAGTFLEAGWDFVDEIENGTEDIWWILEGKDYPRLWWEAAGM